MSAESLLVAERSLIIRTSHQHAEPIRPCQGR